MAQTSILIHTTGEHLEISQRPWDIKGMEFEVKPLLEVIYLYSYPSKVMFRKNMLGNEVITL